MIMAVHHDHHHHHPTLKLKKKNAGKDSYLDLVVITLLLAAILTVLVMTPTINMTSTVPMGTQNKTLNGIGLLIVVFLLVWSLVFRILWAIPRCKQRCYVSQNGDIDGTSWNFLEPHAITNKSQTCI